MIIVILGAAGQVGSEVAKAILCAFSNSECELPQIIELTRNELDVSDLSAVGDMISRIKPHWVVNATAYTAVDMAEEEAPKAFLINESLPERLAIVCQQESAALIHISTDYVFSGAGDIPHKESDRVSPLGVYGSSKLAGELAIQRHLQRYLNIRTAWVFGKSGNNFVKTMLRLAEDRLELSVVADQFGAPTSAVGIANALASLIISMADAGTCDPRWGTYHYSGYPFLSWADFSEEIFKQGLNKNLISKDVFVNRITSKEFLTPAKRPSNSRLDCSKIQKVFGVAPDDWHQSLSVVLDELLEGLK